MRNSLNSDLKTAMKAGDKRRVETIRLINAALKDRDIEARTVGAGQPIGDAEILTMMQKMVKSRQESVDIYQKAGREELAEREREEIDIINGYLPQPMSEADTTAAIDMVITKLGATSIKDMGKVVAALRDGYAGRMDFAKASALIKTRLAV